MIYIVAMDMRAAQFIAKHKGLHPQDWRYVRLPESLRGIGSGAEIWCYDEWDRNLTPKDVLEIRRSVHVGIILHNWTVKYIAEPPR